MSQGKIEGDTSQLSSRQIEFIIKVLNEKGFLDAKVVIKPVGDAGDNYSANVIRITAEKDGESLNIVAKVAPKIEQLRSAFNTRNVFINEHVMYTEVLPKFTELEVAAGIPEDERLRYADCYGNLMDDCEELILLEDLKASGFEMLNRFKPLTKGEIKPVLKSFARYHSLSYALKYKQPDVYNNLKSKLVDVYDVTLMAAPQVEQMKQFCQAFENGCIAICDPKYKDNIKGTISKMVEFADKLRDFSESSRFSVIQHGDSWTNNILFKLQDGQAVSCCMIDYQLSKVNSPVADLHYMLFNCTDHESRKHNYLEWIDYYHKELGESLSEFGLKANFVYPRDQLDADLKRYGKHAVGLSLMVVSAISREADSAKELKTAMENSSQENMQDMGEAFSLTNLDGKTLAMVKSRIEGIFETCLQFGLL